MIRINGREIRTYNCKVTLTTLTGEEIHYTDTPSLYETMVDKFKHIISVKIEPVELTADQNTRLEALRSLSGELEEKHERVATDFVRDGYLSPQKPCETCAPRPMIKLLAKWDGVAKEALLAKYKSLLGDIRKVREFGGVKFRGYTAGSEKEDQNSISNTVMVLEKTGINSVNFKFKDGWSELTLNDMILLSAKVATHVQLCFVAENQIVEQLKKLPLEALYLFKENPYESVQEENKPSIETMYNELLDKLEETMDN